MNKINRFSAYIILMLALSASASASARSNQFVAIPEQAKRLVFIGDSITYSGEYVAYFESYLSVASPNRQLEIINIGLPSETVSGLSEVGHAKGDFPRPDAKERLQPSLNKLKPDIVFSCYGMNDGIYLPFNQARFTAFKNGINNLHKTVLASGAEVVHITPPDYDAIIDSAYSVVLDHYSNWLISKQHDEHWQVIDVHFPMQLSLQTQRKQNKHFYYSKDGIHPNPDGHWQIAKALLNSMGYPVEDTFEDSIKKLNPSIQVNELFELVKKRQTIIKDAYLAEIGHKRPRMKQGMPLSEALIKGQRLNNKINKLVTLY
ncbi:SGNH/GDSL hydrolase family protein [Paraglaciecola aquimarina]|uniref:SGNH/GDSL hydrolase family protein n=1 Tax=Paraglaciecola algarum TaxID=3050085 RepID=A0ABS9D5K1_9ALTE|nr:SGNH/GDSL hydrolase family protein [Paraglaciecola sp. G1-23]MCF2947094.1 SGNH/GDSL hydrolase family protein [Paraglaciecola sp. G1-23]